MGVDWRSKIGANEASRRLETHCVMPIAVKKVCALGSVCRKADGMKTGSIAGIETMLGDRYRLRSGWIPRVPC